MNALKLACVSLLLCALGCSGNHADPVPPAPYGLPDDTTIFEAENYYSITYVYLCYDGLYRLVTYSVNAFTGYWTEWELSIYTSSCFSGKGGFDSEEYGERMDRIESLYRKERLCQGMHRTQTSLEPRAETR